MRALFLLLLLFIAGCAHTPLKHTKGVSILQVGSTDSSAEFNLLAPTGSEVEISVTGGAGVGVPQISRETVTHPQHPLSVHQFQVKGLPSPTDTYVLVVKIDGREVDRRNFRLFSNRGEGMTFVVGSCSDHRYTENQSEIWNAVAAKKPEWLFLIGDNLYSVHKDTEVRSESQLWQAYVDSRQTLELYYLKDLIPTHAIWDDNDYGQKDGGSDYALKSASQEVFRTFFRPRFGMETMVTGPGVASRLNLRGMHFTFLDNRSFREASTDGEHFGKEQEDWLFKDLKEAQLPTWIISGDQFFGGYHSFESYEGRHPRAFESFLSKLKEVPTPFLFVSGDRHLTEVMQFPKTLFGQLSFEFTSSPLHAKTYPGNIAKFENPWRVIGRDGTANFMLLTTRLEESSWNIDLRSLNHTGQELFRREFSLTTEALKDFTIEKQQKRRRYRRARWRR